MASSATPLMLLLAAGAMMPHAPARGADEAPNRVVIEHGKLAIDHSQGIAEITRAQAKGGFRVAYGAEIGLGLFQNRMTTTLDITAREGKPPVLTTRIKTEPVIYIAREFPADSCAYQLVLRHEWQHYLFDRDVLRAMPDEARAIAQDLFAPAQPVGEAGLQRAKQVFFQRFGHAYDGRSFPLHARIDSPAAYAELAAQCRGEIAQRLGGKKS